MVQAIPTSAIRPSAPLDAPKGRPTVSTPSLAELATLSGRLLLYVGVVLLAAILAGTLLSVTPSSATAALALGLGLTLLAAAPTVATRLLRRL